MIAKILLASVLMIAFCTHSGTTDILHAQKAFPRPIGSCVTIDCKPSESKAFDMECDRKFIKEGKQEQEICLLKKNKDGYDLVDKNGESTGQTAKIVADETQFITKFTRMDAKTGKTIEICCTTKTLEISDDQRKKMDQVCNEEGYEISSNENCPK